MLNLLKLLLNHDVYQSYHKFIYNLIKNNRELETLFQYIQTLQTKYNRDISIAEMSLFVLSNCLDRDKEKFTLLLTELAAVDSSSEILDDVLTDIVHKHKAYEVSLCAIDVSEGRKAYTDLLLCLEDLNASTPLTEPLEADAFVSPSLQEIYNGTITQHGLRWRLSALNKSLGSLRKGDFGFIFARPETGKTTFLTSEITHFAQQTEQPILWFNNEEQGVKVQLRLYQAYFGYELVQLFANIQDNEHEYLQKGMDKVKIIDDASISKSYIEQLCKKYKPSLVVMDQIDKTKGFDGDREDLRLGNIYTWARELAKTYCPILAVCQSAATGEGKKWLQMDDVANAKTAKQAEADFIIGIGKTHHDAEQYQRFLSICKNKLIGDQDTDPLLRHGHLTVNIMPEIGRYSD